MQRAHFLGRCSGRGFGPPFGRRQVRHRLRLVSDADMRVPHRHVHVRVPGQFLGFRQRRSVAKQLGDKRVPPGGVKVSDPFFRFIRDADPLQIFPYHQPRFAPVKPRKQHAGRLQPTEPLRQQSDQFRM